MPAAVDTIAPATAAIISALITWQLGRRTQHSTEHDTAFDQLWKLVEGYRGEIDRLRVRVADLEQEIQALRDAHERDRSRWAGERRALIAAFRSGDATPPPGTIP